MTRLEGKIEGREEEGRMIATGEAIRMLSEDEAGATRSQSARDETGAKKTFEGTTLSASTRCGTPSIEGR